MRHEWWIPIVQWSVWGLIMAVVMGWVARSRLGKRPVSEVQTLRHPRSTLLIGVVGALFFLGIAVVSNTVSRNHTATIWTTLLFIFFGLASLTMVADYFFARHKVSDAGIDYGRMFGQRGNLLWSDVRRVRFASAMKWFVLEPRAGGSVRVSAMLMGLPEFARLLLLHVPAQLIDDKVRAVLDATRGGHPPSVWG
jgi:Bacterial PH domain